MRWGLAAMHLQSSSIVYAGGGLSKLSIQLHGEGCCKMLLLRCMFLARSKHLWQAGKLPTRTHSRKIWGYFAVDWVCGGCHLLHGNSNHELFPLL
mmetsp:Transcript_84534/g.141221  ORF Transcript_84534/g.141221 Transcript_84534/m.141221 type:complete len:95 (+) Transcript_84534:798-1082(+)